MEYLIPSGFFLKLTQPVLIVLFAVGLAVVVKGADWLVDGMANLAYRMGISKTIVAATILSLGTTSPETAVSVTAAWQGKSGLALGNSVGSYICNTGVIFALGCLLSPLPADRFVLQRQGLVKIGSAILLAILCYVAYALYGDAATLARWAGCAPVSSPASVRREARRRSVRTGRLLSRGNRDEASGGSCCRESRRLPSPRRRR